MNLAQSFVRTVSRFQLFTKSDRLLIAVSGGIDSTVLATLCSELGYHFGIAHVNFQLRAEASDDDAAFVESLAQKLDVPYYEHSEDCAQYAKTHNLSIQEAARNIRYDFFETICAVYDYTYLLTAHHAGDNVETMLYTMAKGATLKGLRGIPLQRGEIRRPLIYTEKSAIESYAKEHHIAYREDASNTSTKYRRNYIRHEVLPQLLEINPNLESTWSRSSKLATSYIHLIQGFVKEARALFLQNGTLELQEQAIHPSRSAWLFEMIHPLGFNFNDVEDIWEAYDSKHTSGQIFLSKDHTLSINRKELVLHQIADEKPPLTIHSLESANTDCENRLRFERSSAIIKDSRIANFDLTKIEFPLTLRRWQPGDRFQPIGMNGQSKKVKDFLTGLKLNRIKKANVEVLLSNGSIIWVVGHRIAHEYAADTTTEVVLKITER